MVGIPQPEPIRKGEADMSPGATNGGFPAGNRLHEDPHNPSRAHGGPRGPSGGSKHDQTPACPVGGAWRVPRGNGLLLDHRSSMPGLLGTRILYS